MQTAAGHWQVKPAWAVVHVFLDGLAHRVHYIFRQHVSISHDLCPSLFFNACLTTATVTSTQNTT